MRFLSNRRRLIHSFYFVFLFFGIHTSHRSAAAELMLGNVCWYTVDTLLTVWSSGFVSHLINTVENLKKRDALIQEIIINNSANPAIAAPHTYEDAAEIIHEQTDDDTYEKLETTAVAPHPVDPSTNSETFGTITLTNRPVYYATNLSAQDVYAAEQFLKPLERYDLDINNHITPYHDNRGAIGLQSGVGTTNVRIGTGLISIFYLLNALRNWWQRKEADATIQSYDTAYVTIRKTPEEKEAIHCGSIKRLKDDLTQKVPRWNDAHLIRKEEILQDWKHGQEKALKKYIAYLAKTQTPQRMRQLVEAKRSAEQQIETFNLKLDAIKAEQLNRLHKKNSSKNTNAIYASNSGNCASPGGKDPKDTEKKKRYQGPKYANMNEVFRKEKIGKRLQECSKRIEGEKFNGAQVYRVKKDMPELGLYENDVFYLDSYHGEHIEAFKGNREGSPRNVLSVDGRSLLDKLAKALDDGRTYTPGR